MSSVVAPVNNIPVRLTDERWMHIVENHNDLAGYYDKVLEAVANPKWVIQGYYDEMWGVLEIKENKVLDKDINYEYKEKDRLKIYADKLLIKQLMRIFIENSRKYTDNGGNIIIKNEKVKNNIKITIEDDGKGIPKEDIPYIFDRFYKIDKSRSDEKGSSGLGLSIAMKIIELHNGDIDVESEVGEGTKITIFIPLENN